MPSIREMILSEQYADIILPVYTDFKEEYKEHGAQIFNDYYGMVHYLLEEEVFQNYYDYGFFYIILPVYTDFKEEYKEHGAQIFNDYYGMVHYLLEEEVFQNYYDYGFFYNTIPKLLTLLDMESLEISGITAVQNQPVLGLNGRDVLIGFLDTGIDCTHPAFRYSDGSSRIVGQWPGCAHWLS